MVYNKNQNEINDSSTPSFENSNVDKNLGQEFNDSDIEDEVPF